MRPGQTAPECHRIVAVNDFGPFGFNEAGADCPGMRGKFILYDWLPSPLQ